MATGNNLLFSSCAYPERELPRRVTLNIEFLTAPAMNVAKAAELAYMVIRRHRQVYRQV
jgi:hypothetical protein